MEKEFVFGTDVPQSHLPFSPGVKCGQFLFVSGQASVDLEGKIVTDSFENECRRSFDNLKRIVEAAGARMADVVKVGNYVSNEQDLPAFNAIYKEYFSAPYPARTTLIGCLGTALKFEVDATVLIK